LSGRATANHEGNRLAGEGLAFGLGNVNAVATAANGGRARRSAVNQGRYGSAVGGSGAVYHGGAAKAVGWNRLRQNRGRQGHQRHHHQEGEDTNFCHFSS
jgi:hypothetical protein